MPVEETEKYIRVRVADPKRFSEFRVSWFSKPKGIRVIWGHLKNSKDWIEQAFLFLKSKGWTKKSAIKWCRDHKYKPMSYVAIDDVGSFARLLDKYEEQQIEMEEEIRIRA